MEKIKKFLKFVDNHGSWIKWLVVIIVIIVLALGGLRVKDKILGLFVTRGEYQKTLEKIQESQAKIDSLTTEVLRRDAVIIELKNKKQEIEANRLKNQKIVRNARGNIAALDSIADRIF